MAQSGDEIEQRLKALGFTLPQPAAPIANYVPSVVSGALLFVSGQLPFGADGTLAPAHVGKVGAAVSRVGRRASGGVFGAELPRAG